MYMHIYPGFCMCYIYVGDCDYLIIEVRPFKAYIINIISKIILLVNCKSSWTIRKEVYFSSSVLEISILGKKAEVLPRGIAPWVDGKSL